MFSEPTNGRIRSVSQSGGMKTIAGGAQDPSNPNSVGSTVNAYDTFFNIRGLVADGSGYMYMSSNDGIYILSIIDSTISQYVAVTNSIGQMEDLALDSNNVLYMLSTNNNEVYYYQSGNDVLALDLSVSNNYQYSS